MEQSAPPPPPPPSWSPPAPPARSNKSLWLIIGVIVIAVVVIAAAFLLMGGGSDGNGDGDGDNAPLAGETQVGDFLKYQLEMDAGLGSIEYLYWMNVTEVDATGYTILLTTWMEGWGEYSDSYYVNEGEELTPMELPDDFVDKGQTTISTEFGSRSVHHYQAEDEYGVTSDYYIGINNGVLYKMEASGGGVTAEMNLEDSNISWV